MSRSSQAAEADRAASQGEERLVDLAAPVGPQPLPIYLGISSQGRPVLRTKRMPVSTWGSSRRLWLGKRRRRGLGSGSSGRVRSQWASSNGLAMSDLLSSVYPLGQRSELSATTR